MRRCRYVAAARLVEHPRRNGVNGPPRQRP
jgi:hypothetical protein